MRRTFDLLLVALVLVGFELASGTVSTTLDRFTQTLSTTMGAADPSLPPMRFLGGVAAILMGVLGLVITVWTRHAARNFSRGSTCVSCGGRTQRIKRKIRHRALGLMLGRELTRRRCVECGRSGLALRQ